jgi:hypothetical protein
MATDGSLEDGCWLMEVPLENAAKSRSEASYRRAETRGTRPSGGARAASLLAQVRDELRQQTQSTEAEQMGGAERRQVGGSSCRCIGVAEGDGSVAAIRQGDDDIRVLALTDVDDRQLLSAEWVMGMGNGHESQRNLG